MRKYLLKTAVLFGLLSALVCFLYMFTLNVLGNNPFGRYQMMYLGFYGMCIAVGMWYFRDRQNAGVLRPQVAILFGMILNTVGTVFLGLLLFVWTGVLDQEQKVIGIHREQSLELIASSERAMKEAKDSGQLEEEQFQENMIAFEDQKEAIRTMDAMYLSYDQSIRFFIAGMFLTFFFMLIMKSGKGDSRGRSQISGKSKK
ncbi:DUF4199 domain-containing protein [Algivirga pacifica]|uniref:DUF4199 domain-containing protein n=1 Tax=Algivirga pacifica TaxID=1162670 RepID=A0ABP9D9Q8_9BACT